jgi:cyclohexanone monooxygenase
MTATGTTPIDPAELGHYRTKYRQERDKRVNPDRRRILDLPPESEYLLDPYTPVAERSPISDDVDALVVGGGFGGLLAAVHLRKQGVHRIRIVDRAGDVGGVWYWNRYPGAMCDVESYVYLPLLEELGYVPERRYAFAPEILAYTQKIAEHFELYDLALFHTAVTGLSWDAEAQNWRVRTDRGDEFGARYAVVAHGSFTSLKLPAIEGIETFKGRMFHASRWDYEYTGGDSQRPLDKLGDKTVGVVGTGATAVQIVPPLGEAARQLYVFQRTPSTVAPRNNSLTEPGWADTLEPGWHGRRRENFTDITNGAKVDEDLVADGWTVFYQAMLSSDEYRGLDPQAAASRRELLDLAHMESIRARIDEVVQDRAVAEALKPYYRYQCKRPTFHDEYLPTFNRPNVRLVDTDGQGIRRITETGVVVGETEYPVDCLVLATGFDQDSSYVRRIGFDVTGVDGVRLSQKWQDGPETLHGVLTSGFPNFFVLPTNNMQGTAAINFVHPLEETAIHVAAVIAELERRGVVADVDRAAELEYVASVTHGAGLSLLGSGTFLQDCTPGRWNNEGDPDGRPAKNINYPGTSAGYFQMLKQWREQGDLHGLVLTPSRKDD